MRKPQLQITSGAANTTPLSENQRGKLPDRSGQGAKKFQNSRPRYGRAYIADEDDLNKNEFTEFPEDTYPVDEEQEEEEDFAAVNLAMPEVYTCARCHVAFESNSKLHRHVEECTDSVEKIDSAAPPKVVVSTAPKPEGTGYSFRRWHYVEAELKLSENAELKSGCWDTGYGVSLVDRQFLRKQSPNTKIETLPTPLPVRGIGSNKHFTNEFVLQDIYVPAKNDKAEDITLHFYRELHIVDDLKAGILIGTDIMGIENVVLDLPQRTAIIGSCDNARVSLNVTHRRTRRIERVVRIGSNTILPPRSKATVAVSYTTIPEERDFLFEPAKNFPVALYAHLVDASTKCIVAENESDLPVTLPKRQRVGRIVEFEQDLECFLTKVSNEGLAKLSPRSTWERNVLNDIISTASITPNPPSAFNISTDGSPPIDSAVPTPERQDDYGVTYYGSLEQYERLRNVVYQYPTIWTDTGGFADVPEDKWMTIPLKEGWQDKTKGKAKVYPLGIRDREIVDKEFDKLHAQGRMEWTSEHTPFTFPVFVVWRELNGSRKGRAVVDICGLNQITIPDAYPLPLQWEIIAMVRDSAFISTIDCVSFFYQWRTSPRDRHKLTVVSHRGQETFNVTVMGFRNSPAYTQRQIDLLLRPVREFARAYVDDIVIFSRTLEEHEKHLHAVFSLLQKYNISIKPTKSFIGYPSVALLG